MKSSWNLGWIAWITRFLCPCNHAFWPLWPCREASEEPQLDDGAFKGLKRLADRAAAEEKCPQRQEEKSQVHEVGYFKQIHLYRDVIHLYTGMSCCFHTIKKQMSTLNCHRKTLEIPGKFLGFSYVIAFDMQVHPKKIYVHVVRPDCREAPQVSGSDAPEVWKDQRTHQRDRWKLRRQCPHDAVLSLLSICQNDIYM